MAVNWQRSRDLVTKAVNNYGRPITMLNDTGPLDVTNPLGGPGQPQAIQGVMAIFVRPSGYIKLGESSYMEVGMWEEAEKIALVLPSLTYDFARFTRIVDADGQGFKIFKVEELSPGPVPILLYLGLRQ